MDPMPPSPNSTRAFLHPAKQRGKAKTYRPGPAPKPGFAHLCEAVAGLGLGGVIGAVVTSESRGALASPGGVVTAIGRFAGFTGAYCMLIMVFLIARISLHWTMIMLLLQKKSRLWKKKWRSN